jgi:signal transduction histidine kinase
MIANGRINILQPPNALTLQDKPVYTSSYNDAMTGNWSDTPLSKAFFSVENQQILQNGIRAGVYEQSRGKYMISQQSIIDESRYKEKKRLAQDLHDGVFGRFADRQGRVSSLL